MIRLYSNQLAAQLNKNLASCYFLSGNEPLILKESQDLILQEAQKQQFKERHSILLCTNTDWGEIFSICQEMSLFAHRKILQLKFPENGLTPLIEERISKLASMLHEDILLILYGMHLTKRQESSAWFKVLSQNAIKVSCYAPTQAQLPYWIYSRAKIMQLELHNAANKLLCYCYEGNLLALVQTMERLSLLYPDGKLTLQRIRQEVNDTAHFTVFHWSEALLAGRSNRALHILQKLQQENVEPVILLRTLQRELLLLLILQRGMDSIQLQAIFNPHYIWQNRRNLMKQAVQRISTSQLYQIVKYLKKIEVTFKKKDDNKSVWLALETISMLLCGKTLPESFINDQ